MGLWLTTLYHRMPMRVPNVLRTLAICSGFLFSASDDARAMQGFYRAPDTTLTRNLTITRYMDPTLRQMIATLYDNRNYEIYRDKPTSINPEGRTRVVHKDTAAPFYSALVEETTAFPWQYVGFVEVQHTESKYGTCTGTLLSRHVVITAAHCLYDDKLGYLNKVRYYPALNGRKAPYGGYNVVDTVFLEEMRPGFDNNFDLAFVVLEESPLSKEEFARSQTVPVGVVDDAHFAESEGAPLGIIVAGYPNLPDKDKRAHRLHLAGTTIYRNSIVASKNNQFEHRAITAEGTSGGPVFAIDPIHNQFALVGIVSGQRTWVDGDSWAVAIKINPFTQQKTLNTLQQFEPDYQ